MQARIGICVLACMCVRIPFVCTRTHIRTHFTFQPPQTGHPYRFMLRHQLSALHSRPKGRMQCFGASDLISYWALPCLLSNLRIRLLGLVRIESACLRNLSCGFWMVVNAGPSAVSPSMVVNAGVSLCPHLAAAAEFIAQRYLGPCILSRPQSSSLRRYLGPAVPT